MKKIMFPLFAATILCAGSSMAQNQKANTSAPVKNVGGAIAPTEASAASAKKESKTAPEKKKETKATSAAKKEAGATK